MITIFKNDEKIICSKQTYEEQFKHLGYQIASEKEEATKKVASFEKEEAKKDEEIELEEKLEEIELEEKLEEKYKVSKTTKGSKNKKK